MSQSLYSAKHERHFGLGWHKDVSGRSYRQVRFETRGAVPPSGLITQMGPVFDQGQLGSCVSNATAAALMHDMIAQGLPAFAPSRLFIYYNGRAIEGTIPQDSGLTIADGVKSAATNGFPDETLWPYDISKFTAKPPQSVYNAATPEIIKDFATILQTPQDIKAALAANKPVLFGFNVYSSFMDTGSDGIVPKASGAIEGGHANLLIGWDDGAARFRSRNSWGTSFGLGGDVLFPYDFILSGDCSDFWVINTIPGGVVPPPSPPGPPPPVPVPPVPPPPVPPGPLPPAPPSLRQQIDALFAKLLQMYARYPTIVWALTISQTLIDRYLGGVGAERQIAVAVNPSILQQFLDEALDALIASAGNPFEKVALEMTKALIDQLLASQG